MEEIFLNFSQNKLSKSPKFFFYNYSQIAIGWKDDVYYPRKPQINKNYRPEINKEGLKVFNRTWEEIGEPLKNDKKTCAHNIYSNTLHLVLNVKNINYKLTLELKNPYQEDKQIDIVINDISEKTLTIPRLEKIKVNLQIALSRCVFDLCLINHERPSQKKSSKEEILYLCNLKMTPQYKYKKSSKLGIFIASDSTAQTYSLSEFPQSGWGAELYHFIKGDRLQVSQSSFYSQSTKYEFETTYIDNRSLGARSIKTFLLEGRLEAILKDICPGDYLLIQFGDNDATTYRPDRFVNPKKFEQFLKEYIDSVRIRKAHPVLISPPTQYKFDDDLGEFKLCFNDYREAMIQVSKKENIPFIDLGKESTNLLNKLGRDAAHSLFLQVSKSDFPNLSENKMDVTHFRKYGAFIISKMIATHLKELIGIRYFQNNTYGYDYRPIINNKLNELYISWPAYKSTQFYVIKSDQEYLATTLKNSIYLPLKKYKLIRIIPYKEDKKIKEGERIIKF